MADIGMSSSDSMPGQGALSSALSYLPNPRAVRSKSYTQKIPSSNGSSHTGGQTVQITVPTGPSCGYLNTSLSYLSFTINNKDTSHPIRLDQTGACVIHRLDIYSGGSLVEQLDNYNVMVHLFADIQQNSGDRVFGSSIASGAEPLSEISLSSSDGTLGNAKLTNDVVGVLKKGREIAASGSLRVSIPLVSGVLGPQLTRYLPLCNMTAGPLRIDVTLAPLGEAFIAPNATANYTVSEVEYNAHIVDISPEAQAMIDSSTPVKFINSQSYRNFQGTIPQDATTAVTPIAARFSSMNAVFMCMRSQPIVGDKTAPGLSNRSRATMTDYSLRVGTSILPNQPIKTGGTGGEAFTEVMKALHSVSAINAHTSLLAGQYIVEDAQTEAIRGSFVFALETESFSHRSDSVFSGISTLNTPVFVEQRFEKVPDHMVLDCFVSYSTILQVGPDGVLRSLF